MDLPKLFKENNFSINPLFKRDEEDMPIFFINFSEIGIVDNLCSEI